MCGGIWGVSVSFPQFCCKTKTALKNSGVFFLNKWCQKREASSCPSMNEYLNKMWYIQRMGYYSVLKSNKILLQAPWTLKTLRRVK